MCHGEPDKVTPRTQGLRVLGDRPPLAEGGMGVAREGLTDSTPFCLPLPAPAGDVKGRKVGEGAPRCRNRKKHGVCSEEETLGRRQGGLLWVVRVLSWKQGPCADGNVKEG